MKKEISFLSPDEREEFNKDGRCKARFIEERPKDDSSLDSELESYDLRSYIVDSIRERALKIDRPEPEFMECFVIQTNDGDGMSWSAESVRVEVAEKLPNFNFWCLTNHMNIDRLPAIADFLGLRNFLKLASKCKITQSFFTLKSWPTYVVILSAIFIGVAIKILQLIMKTKTDSAATDLTGILLDPFFYIPTVSIIGLGLLAKYVWTLLTTRTTSKSLEKFLAEFETGHQTAEFNNLAELLSEKLIYREFPRVIIIDNFETVDSLTKQIIRTYFSRQAEYANKAELWVIFEKDNSAEFSNIAIENDRLYGYERVRLFQQKNLSHEKKKELARQLGRREDAAEFTSVKRVCRDETAGEERLLRWLRDYRNSHPADEDRYSDLDFIFLISLNAYPGNCTISQKEIVDKFSVKHGLRSVLVKNFLSGSTQTKHEFRTSISNIEREFNHYIKSEGSGVFRSLQVTPEITSVLAANAAELGLPSVELGHLLWSIFWYDKLQNHPTEAFWIRKLKHHLLKAKVFTIREEADLNRIIPYLFEACLFTVDGCLKTCMFENLGQLLEKALGLLQMDALSDSRGGRSRFLRNCWEVFSVMGEEAILDNILEVYHEITQPSRHPEEAEDDVKKLFFESMCLTQPRRIVFNADFFTWAQSYQNISESISDFADARAVFISQLFCPLLGDIYMVKITDAIITGFELPDLLVSNAARRLIKSADENIRITDAITHSLALWSYAQKSNPQIVNICLLKTDIDAIHKGQNDLPPSTHLDSVEEENDFSSDQIEKIKRLIKYHNSKRKFYSLVQTAEDSILLAEELKKQASGEGDQSGGYDFLMNALSREISAISLSSIVIAYKYLSEEDAADLKPEYLNRINEIIEICNDFLNYDFPQLDTFADISSAVLARKLDALMKLCSIIWHRFNLERLSDLMRIRRFFFNFFAFDIQPHNFKAYQPLLDSIAPALNKQDYTGLAANIVVANCLQNSRELRDYYLINAGNIVLANNFGEELKREIALIVLFCAYGSMSDFEIFLRQILAEHKTATKQSSYLKLVLERVKPSDLPGFYLRLLNISEQTDKNKLGQLLRQTLADFIPNVQDASYREELETLMDIFDLARSVRLGEDLDLRDIIKSWQQKKNSWMYPWLLNLLINSGYLEEDLKLECADILSRNPEEDHFNTYYLLAINYVEKCAANENNMDQITTAIEYIEPSVEKWEKLATAEENLRGYRILARFSKHDPEKYFKKMLDWEQIKIHRDHLKRMPELVKQGRYFILFMDYFNAMKFHGLETEIDFEDLYQKIHTKPQEKIKLVEQWKSEGGNIPHPFTNLNGKRVVSAEFIYLGNAVFSPPLFTDPAFSQDRNLFDSRAKGNWEDLIEIILNLPKLPPSIKELLKKYTRRLLEYTQPQD